MNQFQGPGPDRPPIDLPDNAWPGADPAEVRTINEILGVFGRPLVGEGEDPDVVPLEVTAEDEAWARDRVNRLLGGRGDWR